MLFCRRDNKSALPFTLRVLRGYLMFMSRIVSCLCFVTAVLMGCAGGGSSDAGGLSLQLPTRSFETISYVDVRDFIFAPHCYGCHSAAAGNQGGINLETFQNAFSLSSQIRQQALVTKAMPKFPNAPLTESQAKFLRLWLDAGSPLSPVSL